MTCRKEGLFIPTAEVKFTWAVAWWFLLTASIFGTWLHPPGRVRTITLLLCPRVTQRVSAGMICSVLAFQSHSREKRDEAVSPPQLGLIQSLREKVGRRSSS